MNESFLPTYILQSFRYLHVVHGNDTGAYRVGQNVMSLYNRSC